MGHCAKKGEQEEEEKAYSVEDFGPDPTSSPAESNEDPSPGQKTTLDLGGPSETPRRCVLADVQL